MKFFVKGFILFSCLGLIQNVYAANTGLTATSLKLKVFKFAVSTSPLCTNLITVLDNGNTPTEVDFLANPSLGSGNLSNGTYPCIVIEMTDLIKFTPEDSTAGNCSHLVESTLDICRSDNGSGGAAGTSVLIDGTTTTCGVAGTADRVALYISTATSGDNGDAFNRPTVIGDTTKGITLGAALTISGTSSGKFVVNPAGQVCDKAAAGCDGSAGGVAACALEAPSFSFTKQ